MLGVTMALGIGQAVESEQTAYRLTSQLNALPVVQYLGQAPVVKASVCLAVQDDRGGSEMTCPVSGDPLSHARKAAIPP